LIDALENVGSWCFSVDYHNAISNPKFFCYWGLLPT